MELSVIWCPYCSMFKQSYYRIIPFEQFYVRSYYHNKLIPEQNTAEPNPVCQLMFDLDITSHENVTQNRTPVFQPTFRTLVPWTRSNQQAAPVTGVWCNYHSISYKVYIYISWRLYHTSVILTCFLTTLAHVIIITTKWCKRFIN
jgi:hypothetical protein